jgi:hypothetical protein
VATAILVGAAVLAATADPTPSTLETLRLFGLWRMRHVALAGALGPRPDRAAAGRGPRRRHTLVLGDTHWNAAGHAVAATALHRWPALGRALADRGRPDPPEPVD